MTNAEIIKTLVGMIVPKTELDDAIKKTVLALLAEAEPKATPPKKAAAKNKETKTAHRGLDHGKIVALYKAGWSIKAIADEMGSVDGTIRYHLQKEGLIK